MKDGFTLSSASPRMVLHPGGGLTPSSVLPWLVLHSGESLHEVKKKNFIPDTARAYG